MPEYNEWLYAVEQTAVMRIFPYLTNVHNVRVSEGKVEALKTLLHHILLYNYLEETSEKAGFSEDGQERKASQDLLTYFNDHKDEFPNALLSLKDIDESIKDLVADITHEEFLSLKAFIVHSIEDILRDQYQGMSVRLGVGPAPDTLPKGPFF